MKTPKASKQPIYACRFSELYMGVEDLVTVYGPTRKDALRWLASMRVQGNVTARIVAFDSKGRVLSINA